MKHTHSILCVILLALAACSYGQDVVPPVKAQVPSSTPMLTPLWPVSTGPTQRVEPALKGVPNFGKLNDYIWRSGQPTQEGYKLLATKGLRTVINFRIEFPQDKTRLPKGVKYVYIPIVNDHAPSAAQAKLLIDTVSDAANWPILIHCTAGVGRTGTMSALIRHSLDGWSHDAIVQEIGNYWKFIAPGQTPMATVQQNFIQHWEQTPPILKP